jgi:hypothetical protein
MNPDPKRLSGFDNRYQYRIRIPGTAKVMLFQGEPVTCRGNVFQEEDLPLGDVDAR